KTGCYCWGKRGQHNCSGMGQLGGDLQELRVDNQKVVALAKKTPVWIFGLESRLTGKVIRVFRARSWLHSSACLHVRISIPHWPVPGRHRLQFDRWSAGPDHPG